MTFLLQVRNAAKDCSKPEYRALLRQVADSLEFSIDAFHREPTEDRMRDLNGAWAHAHAVLQATPPEGEPAPISGSPEPAKLAIAA